MSLALYKKFASLSGGDARRTDHRKQRPDRPDAPLLWLHAGNQSDVFVVRSLTNALLDLEPDLWFLVTTQNGLPVEAWENCIIDEMPGEANSSVSDFIDHWRPDTAVWLAGALRPSLLAAADDTGVPLLLFDTGTAYQIAQQRLILPGLKSATLRRFRCVLAGDESTYKTLANAGADAENIEVTGVLEDEVSVLPCNENERAVLAGMLHTRPVWLAAQINRSELDGVLAAQMQVLRRTHRLLLILVPEDPHLGDEFAAAMDERNISYLRRSEGYEPEPHAQVYLADTVDEMGLWYRLAPISFVGQTLANRLGASPNPFHPAALGSVVVHGPGIAPHQNAFMRLERAGASRKVSHSGELATTIEELMAPDKAAELAHAAWQISSAGAQVQERAIEILMHELGRQGELHEAT